MRYEHEDGAIELQFSGCCCPPGERREGQHTNATTDWWRIHWKDGTTTDWERYHWGTRTRLFAQAANNCQDFVEAMKQE